VYQPRHHLSQMHTKNAFYAGEKAALRKKFRVSSVRPPPPPLQPFQSATESCFFVWGQVIWKFSRLQDSKGSVASDETADTDSESGGSEHFDSRKMLSDVDGGQTSNDDVEGRSALFGS